MKFCRLCALLYALAAPSSQAQAAVTSPDPCAAATFRQFDFWLGHWAVSDGSGKPAGTNRIEREQGGCVLVERWTSSRGSTGMSVNYYDPRLGKWRQHWIGLNLILEMSGGIQEGSMVLEGPLQYLAENRVTLLRGVWTQLPDGRVRQHFLESTDDGKHWKDWFDGYYVKTAR